MLPYQSITMPLKIKLIYLGYTAYSIKSLNLNRIKNWKSKLFKITEPINSSLIITSKADLDDWAFSDQNIVELLPENDNDYDILIAITTVPLQDNYYVRRLSNNRLCVTFYEIVEFLKSENIPLENFILRIIYSACLVYKRYNNRIPHVSEITDFTHDETKGCIFDMNGIKNDIIYSTNVPILCDECITDLKTSRIGSDIIDSVKKELKKIKKHLYYRILDLIKMYPICAIVLSSLTALILGILGSLIAAFLWEITIKHWFKL